MNADVIKNRSEIAFFYDVTEGNPNGDPDENKPRIDEETDQCLVTDVRLKRTVRDFLRDHRGKNIYVTRVDDEAVTAKQRMEQVFEAATKKLKDAYKKVSEGKANSEETQEVKKYVCEQLIDIRLFGSTAALAKGEEARGGSIILTGPVQFRMLGKSLHSVNPREVKGTGGFKSREGVTQTTFREDNLLPYALIAFYGTVNENVAQKTGLSENDLILLQDGLWNGTINLNTRSKGEHRPRLLLRVEWRDGNYHMGGLDRMVVLEPSDGKDGRSIRSLKDYALDAAELVEKIRVQKGRIQRIIISEDTDIKWKAGKALRAQLEEVLDKEKEKIQKFDPNDEKLKPKKD
jgi:CRISPR-associated protein Csh2